MINNRVKMQEVMLECGNDELKQTKMGFHNDKCEVPPFYENKSLKHTIKGK